MDRAPGRRTAGETSRESDGFKIFRSANCERPPQRSALRLGDEGVTPQGSVLVAVVLDAESALAGNRNGHALPTLGEPWPSWSRCQSVIFGRARHKPKASRRMDV